MTIKLLATGKTDKKELQQLVALYTRRLSHYVKFEVQIVPAVKAGRNLNREIQKDKEAEAVIRCLDPADLLYLLDENGYSYSSEGFARFLQKQMNSGTKRLILLIGGPYGFGNALYERAAGQISLSKMTFSHQMIRLFIVEQLYRAFTILRNEPYHHQ
jgi:23S rRNA (pseudouridine1915-N3)-methyltransferase